MSLFRGVDRSGDCLEQPMIIMVMQEIVVDGIIADRRRDFRHERDLAALASFLPLEERLTQAIVVVQVRL